jgi:hypothetical protein
LFTNNDQVDTGTPNLGPLGSYGGPTQTHPLYVGSTAINGGNPGGCVDNNSVTLVNDQRGSIRPVAGTCDIGAYEGTAYPLYLPLIKK